MGNSEQPIFKISPKLFQQLSDWQAQIDAQDQPPEHPFGEESHERETERHTHADPYENSSQIEDTESNSNGRCP